MNTLNEVSADLSQLREKIRDHVLSDEAAALRQLIELAEQTPDMAASVKEEASKLVKDVRKVRNPGLMESFLSEYGLSTKEGVALMCLAEALLRVPDSDTIDALIEDKISPSNWGAHLGQSNSSLVNASTWALMLTGTVLREDAGIAGTLRSLLKRVGEPVIRTAVAQAMRELGQQFVLGRNIDEAMLRAAKQEERGFTYSYDMLGEAARTQADARRYHLSYSDAISTISSRCESDDIRENPGISVKLSALHPRYEATQKDRIVPELVNRTLALASLAKSANMGFNIDAEEQDRLDLSLDVIESILSNPALADWDGFGVVVQAYGPRAAFVIDWLHALAVKLDRRIMVRLVKGAYWDTEIKRAQVLGLDGFPVFTRKASTDVSYIACARKLLRCADRIYPQFATHNAHTIAAVQAMAADEGNPAFEFQRLHGMGEVLHNAVMAGHQSRCRIYAPVGAHEDLLAYLVRRLLENGANSSFVNQIVDKQVPVETIVADPFVAVSNYLKDAPNPKIAHPSKMFGDVRGNAKGWDITDCRDQAFVTQAMATALPKENTNPMLAVVEKHQTPTVASRFNPARPNQIIGHAADTALGSVNDAIAAAVEGAVIWSATPASERANCLRNAAELYEADAERFFALACQEAGKTAADAIAELREAVDFLRYYAAEMERMVMNGPVEGRGVFVCISPWNFPLAIFSGQISAALAAGNTVLAKPAEQTPLIAAHAVSLLHKAGIPKAALQLLPGAGAEIGQALVSDPRISGVCFTGSTPTAMRINREMAKHAAPDAPLIAETGGINAMIVDSSALPEQAVRDIIASAFQSAGQRCSALRVLYVQEDIAPKLLKMLQGAMDALVIGDPADLQTDIGPVIDQPAKAKIDNHIRKAAQEGRLLKQLEAPQEGTFVGPALISISGIEDLDEEIFGPVLHVATFRTSQLATVIKAINSKGFGLTFGLHTRIDDRVQTIIDSIKCGNIYINRNQIGAVVASQPFGGEGLSGTGPKAGGPHYLKRFTKSPNIEVQWPKNALPISHATVQAALDTYQPSSNQLGPKLMEVNDMPGPTGESNRLSVFSKGVILCLGPTADAAMAQIYKAASLGCATLAIAPGLSRERTLNGMLAPEALKTLSGFDGVACWGDTEFQRTVRLALADRDGPILPLISSDDFSPCLLERHVCIDTTAAGGNTSLLATA
ncbi:bifunctional proline dehydrogenase/L-glutamate gamma-semialdehyde dehydrogenase PutA [Pararhizobium sp. IMCC21322]|uniref:bifunctional proline dehydrogenase/L-glutamate gamma-semialdehyde dehydrogenase PutA n=1 Tax=Pararhizobium sp. IMCC21322 TaxID=3067903 RepID=UPI002741D9BF|nr:bifunctional proline dehydrogenase/L-glutamate gamma-semialdehyde dehydrogenase PutA [Pararhizobium sp. IMCC21322]